MLDNLIEMMMNCWGVVWQYEGVFIQLGGIWTRSQETSVFVTWTGAYCDIFCNKFHGACNLKYILCWNWIGKKKNKKKLKWKKKIKKKYLKWLRVVFLLYRSSFEILIHFKPMTWQHLKETAIDSCFCGTNMKQTSLFTLGEIKTCQVIKNKYRFYKLLFLQPEGF